MRSSRPYIVLKREVPEAEALQFARQAAAAKNLRGISLERGFARAFTPTARCSVTSSVSPISSISGIQGVETSMEAISAWPGWISLHRTQPRRARNRALSRAGTRAARRLSGASHGRSESAEHRRERNRRRDARVSSAKGDDHSDAAANRRDSRNGEPAELRSQPARRSEAGANEKPRHHRHDGTGLDFQDRHGSCRAERTQGQPDTTIFCENGVWSYRRARLARSQSATAN